MPNERNELERLVNEEKYTIWQLCRHFEKSIHVAFFKWMKKLYQNENELNEIKMHILENSNSLKSEIEFTKEYLESKINSGMTLDELAEENGYPNSIKLYRYMSSLFSDEEEKNKFMELLKANNSSAKSLNSKEKKSNFNSNVEKEIKEQEDKKQIILPATEFIYKFTPEKLSVDEFINDFDNAIAIADEIINNIEKSI